MKYLLLLLAVSAHAAPLVNPSDLNSATQNFGFGSGVTATTGTFTGNAFTVGGSTLVVSGGLVSIGAASGTRKLSVNVPTLPAGNSVGTNFVVTDNATSTMELYMNQSTNTWYSNVALGLSTNGHNLSPDLFIGTNHNVGIGTTSPDDTLSVNGGIDIPNTSAIDINSGGLGFWTVGKSTISSSVVTAGAMAFTGFNTSNQGFLWRSTGNGSTYTSLMELSGTGNLSVKGGLTVNGVNVTGSSTTYNSQTTTASNSFNTSPKIQCGNTSVTGSGASVENATATFPSSFGNTTGLVATLALTGATNGLYIAFNYTVSSTQITVYVRRLDQNWVGETETVSWCAISSN